MLPLNNDNFVVWCMHDVTISYGKLSNLNRNRNFMFKCSRWSIISLFKDIVS